MTKIPNWNLTGDWFDVCSCNIPCPCEFAQAPTDNHCEGVLAWHIREGNYEDVSLDGLNVLAIATFDGNIWMGEAKPAIGIFMDERADEQQREALQMIFGGQAGGWPADFAKLLTDMRGITFAPVAIEVSDDLASWRAEVSGTVSTEAEALSGPTTPPGQRVQLINPPGSEVGPGGVATWGQGNLQQSKEAFGFMFNFTGRSSKHIPFDWSGPGQA